MKYVTWFIGLIVVVIAFIVGSILIRNTLNDNRLASQDIPRNSVLADHIKDDTNLRLSIDGPVTADEKHQSMSIEVTPTSRRITTYKTYGKVVIKQADYPNNRTAFEAFALALDRAGFTAENAKRKDSTYAGECATGRVYTFDLISAGKPIESLWATSCNGATGSFAGNIANVLTLFKGQIPNYSEATTGSTVAN